MRFVKDAYEDADVLLIMVEPKHQIKHIELFLSSVNKSKAKKIVLLNKMDKLKEHQKAADLLAYWKEHIPADDYLPISALQQKGTDELFEHIYKYIPEHPAYYPKDALTDRPERFFVSEIIREKILKTYDDEIPYSVDVIIDGFKDEPKIIRISALIFTNKKSHKPILIGKGGSKLKKVGTEARLDAEQFFGKKIFLELYVKVKENWRDNELMLRHLGYNH